jgi:undecaprenyl-diphosphatase
LALASRSYLFLKTLMSNWVVVLLGIVEGVTEFLPISSTGHLLLVEHGLHLAIQPSEFFNVVIQSGAVLAVLLAFSERLRQMWINRSTPGVRSYVFKLGISFSVTVVGALALKKMNWKLPENPAPVAWATLIGGVIILVLEWLNRNRPAASVDPDPLPWTVALAVGLSQVVAAAFPGTSRSGASILMAMAMGVKRPAAIEFSFLLGVPTLLAAGGYSALSALRSSQPIEPIGQILLGTVVAAVTAFIVVRWLLKYVQSHTLIPFGWYRVILGLFILIALR